MENATVFSCENQGWNFPCLLAFPFIVIMTYHLASVAALVGSDKLTVSTIIGCLYDLCLNIDLAF